MAADVHAIPLVLEDLKHLQPMNFPQGYSIPGTTQGVLNARTPAIRGMRCLSSEHRTLAVMSPPIPSLFANPFLLSLFLSHPSSHAVQRVFQGILRNLRKPGVVISGKRN